MRELKGWKRLKRVAREYYDFMAHGKKKFESIPWNYHLFGVFLTPKYPNITKKKKHQNARK